MFREQQKMSDFAILPNHIYHADCLELMAHIPNGFVSLILTDTAHHGLFLENMMKCRVDDCHTERKERGTLRWIQQ